MREQVAAAGRAGEMQMRHVFDRLASPTDPCKANEDGETKCKRVEAWATGTHEQDYGANGNSTLGALTVGADAAFGKARLGVAFGTGWDVAERISGYRGDVDNTAWMLYGRVALGSVFGLEAVAGRSDLDHDRRRFMGASEAELGQSEGDTTFAGIGVRGQWMFGEGGIGPYVRYERARTTLDGYAESANPLALQDGRL